MKTTQLFVCIAVFTLFGCHNFDNSKPAGKLDPINQGDKFDTTIIRVVDYTGDGILDTAKIHITGLDFHSPFSWKYDLWSTGQIIYHQEGASDSTSDSFFKDTNYVGRCSDYISCKSEFFFHDLGLFIVDSTRYADGIADYMNNEVWGALGLHYVIDSCGVTDKRKAAIIVDSIASVINRTKPKLVAFCESPVESGTLMIFVRRFMRFVPVYHE